MPKTITAASGETTFDAIVGVVFVGVVAILYPFMRVPIAAARQRAVINASVGIDSIAIIAGLKVIIALSEILAVDSITAACRQAAIGAGVAIDFVAVIADLNAIVNLTIAALSDQAVVQAAIGLDSVAVIAELKALGIFSQVIAQEAVTTTRRSALVSAAVKV